MRKRRFFILLCLLGLASLYAGLHVLVVGRAVPRHPLTGRQIAGIATDANLMDRPEREMDEEPDRALQLIAVTPGMVVADVGAGSGYTTVRLARPVGPTGKIYANDLQPASCRSFGTRLANRGCRTSRSCQALRTMCAFQKVRSISRCSLTSIMS